jgi:hypothetical protein
VRRGPTTHAGLGREGLNGDVYYVGLEVRIYEAGADTTGNDYLAEATLWGVEATPEYVGKVLNELFDEALDSLTS